MKVPRILLALFAAIFLLTGCASIENDRRLGMEWTPSEVAYALGGGTDPCEGWNRVMFEINGGFFRFLVRPVGWIWGSIFPKVAITALNNCADNLAFPGRMFSCFLQAKWEGGGMEFARFLANSTIGVAGLWDPADILFEWRARRDNFGQAFATWGIGAGPYFLLPGTIGTNPRDLVGELFDSAFDIKSWLPYAGYVVLANRSVSRYKEFASLYHNTYDPYDLYKIYVLLSRDLQLKDQPWRTQAEIDALRKTPPSEERPAEPVPKPAGMRGEWYSIPRYTALGPMTDTLRVGMTGMLWDDVSIWTYLSPFNTDFGTLARTGVLPPGEKGAGKLRYRFWHAADGDDTAPLAVLLPGTGSHHSNASCAAMAEALLGAGYSVAVLDSVISWSFVESAYAPPLPGYVPDDAPALNRAIDGVLRQVREKYGQRPRHQVLAGWSLGAMHALYIAQMLPDDARFNRILAINPPVDLFYALQEIDSALRPTVNWHTEDALARTEDAFALFSTASAIPRAMDDARPGYGLSSIGEARAKLLIGLSFRLALRDVLAAAVRERGATLALDAPAWSDRTRFYRELDQLSFNSYVSRFLLPAHPELTLEELKQKNSLKSFAGKLGADRRVRVLHNYDDFILSNADRQWLDRAFGSKLSWFDCGGHLGNMYTAEFQSLFLQRLKD